MGKIVKVHAATKQSTPVIVNGRRVDVPHNTDFPLAQAFVEVLTNSRVNFTIVGDVAESKSAGYDKAKDAEEGPGGSASASQSTAEQVPGADSLVHSPPTPALVIITPAAEIDQTPGGDNKMHAGTAGEGITTTGEQRQAAEDAALEQARLRSQSAADGTTEPAVVLTNEDPDQTGKVAREAAEAGGDAEGGAAEKDVLDGSIADLAAHLEGVSDIEEVRRLIRKEKGGKSRVGALEALEGRKADLSTK